MQAPKDLARGTKVVGDIAAVIDGPVTPATIQERTSGDNAGAAARVLATPFGRRGTVRLVMVWEWVS